MPNFLLQRHFDERQTKHYEKRKSKFIAIIDSHYLSPIQKDAAVYKRRYRYRFYRNGIDFLVNLLNDDDLARPNKRGLPISPQLHLRTLSQAVNKAFPY